MKPKIPCGNGSASGQQTAHAGSFNLCMTNIVGSEHSLGLAFGCCRVRHGAGCTAVSSPRRGPCRRAAVPLLAIAVVVDQEQDVTRLYCCSLYVQYSTYVKLL